MTPTETVKLTALVRQLWPSMRVDSHTPDAWHLVLADVPFPAAQDAVLRLARTSSDYIAPADIRRQVAAAGELLAPDDTDAFAEASAVASAVGFGVGRLHPAVRAAYFAVGGSPAFSSSPREVLAAAWRRAYGDARRRYEDQVLDGDLGDQLAGSAAVTAAPERPALPAAPPSSLPPVGDTRPETRERGVALARQALADRPRVDGEPS